MKLDKTQAAILTQISVLHADVIYYAKQMEDDAKSVKMAIDTNTHLPLINTLPAVEYAKARSGIDQLISVAHVAFPVTPGSLKRILGYATAFTEWRNARTFTEGEEV